MWYRAARVRKGRGLLGRQPELLAPGRVCMDPRLLAPPARGAVLLRERLDRLDDLLSSTESELEVLHLDGPRVVLVEVVELAVQLVDQPAVHLLHLQQDELDILELRDLRVAVAMVHGLRARAR